MTQQFEYPDLFPLESGEHLNGFQLTYTTYGKLNAERNNVIWICHALTGCSDPAEWWPGLVGKGKVFDPGKHFIICVNILGGCYGSTGPLSLKPDTHTPYFHSFPQLTLRDAVHAFDLLRKALGIESIHTLVGGSLGGQQALEWAVSKPFLFEHLILLVTNAKHSPWGIAFNESQRMAIEHDITWQLSTPRAGMQGMETARAVAMLSYRTYEIYQKKQQEKEPDKIDYYKAATYQQYQGIKLGKRFNAYTYYLLTKMMDSHQVGRGRGTTKKALQSILARTLIFGIKEDLLFPLCEQEYLAHHIPDAQLEILSTPYGHDGFLLETERIGRKIEAFYHNQYIDAAE